MEENGEIWKKQNIIASMKESQGILKTSLFKFCNIFSEQLVS